MWRLPDGRTIVNPQGGKFFEIAGVKHPEKHLNIWDDATLLSYGIYRVVEVGYDETLYEVSEWTETIDGVVLTRTPTLVARTDALTSKQSAMNEFLWGGMTSYLDGHYDEYTLHMLSVKLDGTATTGTQRNNIISVFDWIISVMEYWSTVKASIDAAPDVPTLEAITWDFTTFDATDPNVTLESVL